LQTGTTEKQQRYNIPCHAAGDIILLMPTAYDREATFMAYRRRLPHLRQKDAVYFVTFRLAGSVPMEKIRQWRAQLAEHIALQGETDDAANHVQRQIERWLDQGVGVCHLEQKEAAEIVEKTLRHFDGERYLLDEFVVMPNHVHAIVYPIAGNDVGEVVRSWKRHSAREINQLQGRTGQFWQLEPFDHIVRDQASLERFRRYIRNNPAKLPGRSAITGRGKFREVIGY
jgi:REP element-mobilizing transposase RayT